MNINTVREELIHTLKGDQAHIPIENIIRDFPEDKINSHITEVPYTPWQLLEHMRLTQRDMLDYIQDPGYKEPVWPDDYWPAKDKTASEEDWNNSVNQFRQDLRSLEDIINDPQSDLTAALPHNPKHTIFREICIIGNHNSYHGGQLLIFKRVFKIHK